MVHWKLKQNGPNTEVLFLYTIAKIILVKSKSWLWAKQCELCSVESAEITV